MAKVTFTHLVESVRGKYGPTATSPIFQKRKSCNVVYHVHNPYTGAASDEQVAAQGRFKTVWQTVTTVMEDPVKLKEYNDAYKANPEKYSSLRMYIFAKEYAKL